MAILITGATGNVGSLVVGRLLARGCRPRVFVRDGGKARGRYGNQVDVAIGDLTDPASLEAALAGVDELFLISTGHDLQARDQAAARAARRHGVKKLVKLSSADARHNVGSGVFHARGESAIRAARINFVFVQPAGYIPLRLRPRALTGAAGQSRLAGSRAAMPSSTTSRPNSKRSSRVSGASGSMPSSIRRAIRGYRPEASNHFR
jgi:uncharacterized protein YbjT (DUF2867 family)